MTEHSKARTWLLTRPDGELLGELVLEDTDMPWLLCHFAPTPAYAAVAPLFERELSLLRAGDSVWREAYAAVTALRLQLRPQPIGASLQPLLLHVQGARAWFRVRLGQGRLTSA
jgi:hypothetical protein